MVATIIPNNCRFIIEVLTVIFTNVIITYMTYSNYLGVLALVYAKRKLHIVVIFLLPMAFVFTYPEPCNHEKITQQVS